MSLRNEVNLQNRKIMDLETIKKLLKKEGLIFEYYQKGWVFCREQEFERTISDWDEKCAPELEKRWRDKLFHLSDQLHFCYTIQLHSQGETSYVGISLFLGEIKYEEVEEFDFDDFESIQDYEECIDFWSKSLQIAYDARLNQVNPKIIELTEEFAAKYCEPDWGIY